MLKYTIRRFAHHSDASLDMSEKLNSEQYEVVTHDGGPMLVLAGAGTGKTTTVTYRVAHLIQKGISPYSVLLLTFTNKAARDMMWRAETLIGESIRGLWGGTFHHLCNMILRRHAGEVGYSNTYTIMDREDSREMIKNCISDIQCAGILPKPLLLLAIIGLVKNTGQPVETILETRFPYLRDKTGEIALIASDYERKKKKLNLMDFDDLLVNTYSLLNTHEDIRALYQERFRHILVDEYQDTNYIQAGIVDLLVQVYRNLMVVGDDAQSIYSFRGANFENVITFQDRYPDTVIFKLTTNYRSTPEILSLANDSISHNTRQFEKELRSTKYPGNKPSLIALSDIFEQAEFIASRILDLSAEGNPLKDISVLYRSHYQSMELQMELQKRGIPFEVRSGLRFFEQAHIKDILAHLKIVTNSRDELNWKRVLKLIPGIGNATAHRIFNTLSATDEPLKQIFYATDTVPKKSMDAFLLFLHAMKTMINSGDLLEPSSAIEAILLNGYETHLLNTYPNAESRMDDINQMSNYALQYRTIEEFVSDLTLEPATVEIMGNSPEEEDAVILSTIHQAKGLEWKNVFVIGLNDGRFPSAKALKNGDEEEERRLFYVASTRGKEELFLCYTLTAGDRNGTGFLKPSRFVSELDERLYDKVWVERE